MKAKPYPKYKPSGVEWLGDVPEHWKVITLKRIVAIPVTDGPHETPEILDEGIPFVSAEAIRNNKIDFDKKRGYITEAEHKRFCLKYHPKRDDIYMIKSGATTGNLAIVETDEEFSIWSPLAVIRVHQKKANVRYVLAAMNSKEFQTSVQLFWSFGTQQNIGMNVIENLSITFPPLLEQQDIAAFLDRETSRIDSLINKKQRLLELLKEQRTALISRAVTKGLDASVKMKPSGVEWLGGVPEHWEVKRLKDLLQQKKGAIKTGPFGSQLLSSEMYDGDVKVYNQKSVITRDFECGENYISNDKFEELKEFQTFPGDFLITTRGTIGRCAILPKNAERGILHPCLMRLQTNKEKVVDRFLEILIEESGLILEQLRIKSNGTTIEVIYQDSLKNVAVLLPPCIEQQAIAGFLDRETIRLDALASKVETAIEKLKEYRTALISAVVTGKIDVREAV